MTYIVFGASGGIGFEWVRYYMSQGHHVLACSTHVQDLTEKVSQLRDPETVTVKRCDPSSTDDMQTLANSINNHTIDGIINATGRLHSATFSPEKTIRRVTKEQLLWSVESNVLPAVHITQFFPEKMVQDKLSYIAHYSARVGSISDNRLGGWYSYRSSKAMLNMILKTASIELKRHMKQLCIIGLHPGTVDTALSAPFQAGVPNEKLFTPEQSVRFTMDTVISTLTPQDTGKFYAWDGKEIEW